MSVGFPQREAAPGPCYNIYCSIPAGTTVVSLPDRPTPVVIDTVTRQILDEVRVPPEILPSVTGGTLNIHVIQSSAGSHMVPNVMHPLSPPPAMYYFPPNRAPMLPPGMSSPPSMLPPMLSSPSAVLSTPPRASAKREAPQWMHAALPSTANSTSTGMITTHIAPTTPTHAMVAPAVASTAAALVHSPVTPVRTPSKTSAMKADSPASQQKDTTTSPHTTPQHSESIPDTLTKAATASPKGEVEVMNAAAPSPASVGASPLRGDAALPLAETGDKPTAICHFIRWEDNGRVVFCIEARVACAVRLYGRIAKGGAAQSAPASAKKSPRKKVSRHGGLISPWSSVDEAAWPALWKEFAMKDGEKVEGEHKLEAIARGAEYTAALFCLRLPSVAHPSISPPAFLQQCQLALPCTVPSALAAPAVSKSARTFLRLRWMAPIDDGGSEVMEYELQASASFSTEEGATPYGAVETTVSQAGITYTWVAVYKGIERAFECKKLRAGKAHAFRVRARNSVGWSLFSPVALLRTDASVPAPPNGLHVATVAATEALLSWSADTEDNGADIIEYVVECASSHGGRRSTDAAGLSFDVLKRVTSCEARLDNLTPETAHSIRVFAVNKIGASLPSEIVSFSTSSEAPSAPSKLKLVGGTGVGRLGEMQCPHNDVRVAWLPGVARSGNGARQCGTRLQIGTALLREGDHSRDDGAFSTSSYVVQPLEPFVFMDIPPGQSQQTLGPLIPGGVYLIRCAAFNEVSISAFSDWLLFSTAADVPGKPTIATTESILSEIGQNSWVELVDVLVTFLSPAHHGDPITHYEVQLQHSGPKLSKTAINDMAGALEGDALTSATSFLIPRVKSAQEHPCSTELPPVVLCSASAAAMDEYNSRKHSTELVVPLPADTLEAGKSVLVFYDVDKCWYAGNIVTTSVDACKVRLASSDIVIESSCRQVRSVPANGDIALLFSPGVSYEILVAGEQCSASFSCGTILETDLASLKLRVASGVETVPFGSCISRSQILQDDLPQQVRDSLLTMLDCINSDAPPTLVGGHTLWSDVARRAPKPGSTLKRTTKAAETAAAQQEPCVENASAPSASQEPDIEVAAAPLHTSTDFVNLHTELDTWVAVPAVPADRVSPATRADHKSLFSTLRIDRVALPGHEYKIRLAACNGKGPGIFSDAYRITIPKSKPLVRPVLACLDAASDALVPSQHSKDAHVKLSAEQLGFLPVEASACLLVGVPIGEEILYDGAVLQLVPTQASVPNSTASFSSAIDEWKQCLAKEQQSYSSGRQGRNLVKVEAVSHSLPLDKELKGAARAAVQAAWAGSEDLGKIFFHCHKNLHAGAHYLVRAALVFNGTTSPFSNWCQARAAPRPPSAPSHIDLHSFALNEAALAFKQLANDDKSGVHAIQQLLASSYRSMTAAKDVLVCAWTPCADDFGSAVTGYDVVVSVRGGDGRSAGIACSYAPDVGEFVEVRTTKQSDEYTIAIATTRNAVLLAALPPSSKISVRVRGVSNVGPGQFSRPIEGTTGPDVTCSPPNILPISVSHNVVRLIGTLPESTGGMSSILGYEVERIQLPAAHSDIPALEEYAGDADRIIQSFKLRSERFFESVAAGAQRTVYEVIAGMPVESRQQYLQQKGQGVAGFKQKTKPDSTYGFRYAVMNIAGLSPWSRWTFVRTPLEPSPVKEMPQPRKQKPQDRAPAKALSASASKPQEARQDVTSSVQAAFAQTADLTAPVETEAETVIDPRDIASHRKALKIARMGQFEYVLYRWRKLDSTMRIILISLGVMVAIIWQLIL